MTILPVWTSPTAFTVGHLETADELNAVLHDNMEFLHAAKYARVYRATSAQSIANNSNSALDFNAESADPWDIHSNSSNPSRLICPAALEGVWSVHAQVQFAADATGSRRIFIYKNGSIFVEKDRLPNATGVTVLAIEAKIVLASTDYIQCEVFQNSGGALNADFGTELTFFEAEWIGAVT